MANARRKKELARQKALRQAGSRVERERRRRQRNAVVAAVLAVLLVAGAIVGTLLLGDDDESDRLDTAAQPTADPTADPTGEPTPAATATPAAGECTYVTEGEPARPVGLPPAEGVERSQAYTATLDTNQGALVFTTDTAGAPCTVHSFRHLAAQNYFADTPCHRLTDQGIFVLQCGDPTGTGRGGPGYSFPDENLEGATYPRGTVAMANSGPDSNGSQFFLVYRDSSLPPQYVPFGTLTEESLAVLDTIAAAGAAPPNESGNTAPNLPVQIESVTVEPAVS